MDVLPPIIVADLDIKSMGSRRSGKGKKKKKKKAGANDLFVQNEVRVDHLENELFFEGGESPDDEHSKLFEGGDEDDFFAIAEAEESAKLSAKKKKKKKGGLNKGRTDVEGILPPIAGPSAKGGFFEDID